ncbi:MAG: DJ-1/PfpI family protein, partial [Deltaproteobacteria bacterium]|nr:DJ-1/PfpI family protein [Deltaproteobacteria bacterium]
MPKVLVPLAEGCEELEAVTIIDLLRRAGIDVVTAGLKPGLVTASRGVQLMPDMTLDAALDGHYDMVVLPGGMPGAAHLKADARIIELLKKTAA